MTKHSKFTAIECVVIVGCLVIVALIIAAASEEERPQSMQVGCLRNLHCWASVFQSYTQDHEGDFNQGINRGPKGLWMNALLPYYENQKDLLLCPATSRPPKGEAKVGTFIAWQRDVAIPGEDKHRFISSYGINAWTNKLPDTQGFPSPTSQWFWQTTRNVSEPNRVPVFGDAIWNNAWPRATDAPAPCSIDVGWPKDKKMDEMNRFCIDRHKGRVNLLFMDGSARRVGLKDLWTLKWNRKFDTAGPWTQAGGAGPQDWPQWMQNFKDY